MNYITIPLDSKHDRSKFSCGKDLLDNYLKKQAGQDVKRKLSACFILKDKVDQSVIGYYTLSASSISNEFIPDYFKKKLPKSYMSIPTILIGRLAVDKEFQGKGFGKVLLIDALKRCLHLSVSIGAFAVIVDPINADAEWFYEKTGFIKLPSSGKMFLPMKTIQPLFIVK